MESKINYVSLNEISTIQTGKKDANYGDKGGEYPFFTCADKPILSPTYSFDGESIILPGNGANVGMVFYHVGKFEAYQRTYVLNNIKCNSRYLFHHLSAYWKKFNLSKQFGSATNYIRMQNFLDYTIPLPPIASQRRIADILDKADEIIRKRKEAIALTEQLQKSIFLDMFGDPVTNPKGWEKVTVNDVVSEVKDGPHVSPEYSHNGIPILSTRNIRPNELIMEDIKYISEDVYLNLIKRFKPQKGDVLLTKGGTTGFAKVVDWDWNFAVWVHLALLRPNNKIRSEFLEATLNSPNCYLQSQLYTHGIANKDLGLNRIRKIKMCLPPLDLQDEYCQIRKKTLFLLNKNKKSLKESENLFNSLLQKAFKGEL
jgi:type I restriction enzyme S subunit